MSLDNQESIPIFRNFIYSNNPDNVLNNSLPSTDDAIVRLSRASENDEEEEDRKKSDDLSESDSYVSKKSPTLDMDQDQLLEHICKFCDNLMHINTNERLTGFGPNINMFYSRNIKQIDITNIIFEVNMITIHEIHIVRNKKSPVESSDSEDYEYTVNISYVLHPHQYVNGNKFFVGSTKSVLKDAISSAYKRLKMLKFCRLCKTAYDSSISEYCVVCLFSHYFTFENPEITCIICTDKTKDFITIPSCGHRFCYECIQNVASRKCPMCRKPFVI